MCGLTQAVLHEEGRLAHGIAHFHRRDAGHGGVRAHIIQHYGGSGYLGAFAHLDASQHLGTCADEHAAAHHRVAVAYFLAGAAQGHLVEEGYIILDDGGLAHHETGAVVEQDTAADTRGGVNIDTEYLAAYALEDGAEVTFETLVACGLVGKNFDGVRILGNGELTKKLTVKASKFTASAKEKIEAVGGTCEVI